MWLLLLLYSTAYAVAAFALYLVYLVIYQFTYWKIRRMPHIELVPVLGNNYPILTRKVSFPRHFQNLYLRYPGARYYGTFDVRKPQVIIKDAELVRDICVKSFDHFVDHEAFVTEKMDPIVGRNIFSLTGQRWKDVRSTLSPSYTAARMKLLFELIVECANEFTRYFIDHLEACQELEAKEVFARYTNDVIATAAFGVKVNSMRDRDNEFFAHGKLATSFDGWWFAKVTLLQMLPRLMRLLGATFLPRAADRFFKRLIRQTVKMREETSIVRPDMIQLLLQAMKNQKEGAVEVSIDDVLGQAFIFFLAGFDTSSSLMAFVLHELAVNQEVQAKLHREIDERLPGDRQITYESLMEMKYLEMVVSEMLRLYPPAPITNRVCTRDYKLPPPTQGCPNYRMQKGTILIIPIFGFHRDPKYFPEPEKFIPERFDAENKAKINPYVYLPFGLGPRMCIGNRFVLMETKIVIVQLLRKFVVKTTEKTSYPVEFSNKGFNLGAANGLWVRLEQRKKSD